MRSEYKREMNHNYLILTGEDQRTVVCDYIAGMTDNYATQQFKDIYVPKSWKGGA